MKFQENFNEAFQSNLLRNTFNKLDRGIINLELLVEEQIKEIKDLKQEIIKLQNEKYVSIQKGVGDIFNVLLNSETKIDEPTTAILLTKIYEMQNIDEIKQYIDTLRTNTLKDIKKKK